MSARTRITAAAAGLLVTISLSGAGGQPGPSGPSFRDRYGVLSERSIFLRERGRPVSSRRESTSRPASSSRTLEESLVLTGVVFENGDYRAYVESPDGSSVTRLRVGEAVGHGIVSAIEMDGIEYDQGGRRTWIDVGRSLTGEPAAAPVSLAASGSTTQPSSGPLPKPGDPNLTMEQKMRLRRMQELNRK